MFVNLWLWPLFLHFNYFYLLRFLYLFIFICLISVSVSAQVTGDSINTNAIDSLPVDSTVSKDTIVATLPYSDSVSKRPVQLDTSWQVNPAVSFRIQILQHHRYFDFRTVPVSVQSNLKVFKGKEILFYVVVLLVIVFAFLKLVFAKYFNDLFRVFFRTTLKQRQIREQLMQTPLPSLLFNLFFIATAGLYINFMLQYFKVKPVDNFWLLYLYCCIGLACIYTGKYIGLKICGWLFNMKQASDAYIFIVFIINKVIGIFLLPFLILLAFNNEQADIYNIVLVITWCGVGGLLLYRFILGYTVIRNEVRFNLFHFFLYLCAFEIAPLLLIYKVLLLFIK